jgi:hypothetical protein
MHSDSRKGGNELMSDNTKQQKKRSTEFLIYNTVSSEQNSIFLNMNFIVYYWTHIQDIIMELFVKHSATHMSALTACMHVQVHFMLCGGKMCFTQLHDGICSQQSMSHCFPNFKPTTKIQCNY